MNQEHDQDRNAYQKLLMEYHVLEQQRDSLERELVMKGGSNLAGEHQRSLSNASTTSVVSASSELPEDVRIFFCISMHEIHYYLFVYEVCISLSL